ncbi:hypothetical protein D3C86_1897330 [compost metagenome]
MRAAATPRCCSTVATAAARRSDRLWFSAWLPVLSVWPATTMVVSAYCASTPATSPSVFTAPLPSVALPVAKVMFSGITSLIWSPTRCTCTWLLASFSRSSFSW